MKRIKERIRKWLIGNDLDKLERIIKEQQNIIHGQRQLLNNVGVAADIHISNKGYSRSWAVINIQGKRDFVKFVDLGEKDIREIQNFLRNFDKQRVNADVPPVFFGGSKKRFLECNL